MSKEAPKANLFPYPNLLELDYRRDGSVVGPDGWQDVKSIGPDFLLVGKTIYNPCRVMQIIVPSRKNSPATVLADFFCQRFVEDSGGIKTVFHCRGIYQRDHFWSVSFPSELGGQIQTVMFAGKPSDCEPPKATITLHEDRLLDGTSILMAEPRKVEMGVGDKWKKVGKRRLRKHGWSVNVTTQGEKATCSIVTPELDIQAELGGLSSYWLSRLNWRLPTPVTESSLVIRTKGVESRTITL